MTNQEILEKAIQKAVDGGWRYLGLPENGWGVGVGTRGNRDAELIHRNEIIFNHDFAKALWGDETSHKAGDPDTDMCLCLPNWQYHLQQMVIAEDPIEYLGENL